MHANTLLIVIQESNQVATHLIHAMNMVQGLQILCLIVSIADVCEYKSLCFGPIHRKYHYIISIQCHLNTLNCTFIVVVGHEATLQVHYWQTVYMAVLL